MGLTSVVLLTNSRDVAVDWVVRELRQRNVAFLRLNTEKLWERQVCVREWGDVWEMEDARARHRLGPGTAFLYRRPEPPKLSGLGRSETRLARAQWSAFLSGLRSIRDSRWINDPFAVLSAESKILQLAHARRLGMPIPMTIITNERASIARFMATTGPCVVKALDAPILGPRKSPKFFFTRLLSEDDVKSMAEVEPAPMIIQQAVLPKKELRVTVVDSTAVGAVATSPSVDWRTDQEHTEFHAAPISSQVRNWSIRLVQGLGLRFGALDFVLDENDRPYFLELNPNGEWGWLQRAGLPIAQLLSAALTEAPRI